MSKFRIVLSVVVMVLVLAGLASLANAAAQDLLVANEAGNAVMRYDGVTGASLGAFVAAGSGGLSSPEDIKFGPDGSLYVAGYFGTVKKYNGSTGAYIGDFVTSGSGGVSNIIGMTFGPDNNLYIANFAGTGGSSVKKYNGSTGAYMGDLVTNGSGGLANPRDLKFGPDGKLYVAGLSNYAVKRYDGTTGAYIDDFVPASYLGQQAAAVLFRGNVLYVSNMANNDIQRYDVTTGYVDTFTLPGSYAGAGTYDMIESPDGRLYAAEAAARVTRSILPSPFLSLGYVPSAIAWTPVPEPMTMSLLVSGAVMMLLRRRK
ncbi:MAG: hypothetical protein A2Y13_02305 [Planctomycetes bacterium GWC2_45_44]|uniref:PEP-CTERM protein-sorting domain-containing protein n=1 Tax=candidate division CPR1 bacterium GW2011_GWA2_42_17 TaxID=1618341 RepID=A0A0G0Z7U0_9BACT|nr:MAG: hypothetical protein UV05_C0002G0011 [candidate division CPR1 bacterium GW2011_GWA2_42_17]OHB44052.1 MAG: hypothetical protein A2Y13_02305 [Planctomycetes bacterium GWC2_45_44]